MATVKELKATARPASGKGAARAERRAGRVPGVIYGNNQPPVTISVDDAELRQRILAGRFLTTIYDIDLEGKKHRVIPRDFHLDPVRDFPLHVDFMRLGEGATIRVSIPLHILKAAGLLVTEGFTTVEELAFTPIEEVAAIEGFDESVAEELVRRAESFLSQRDTELNDKRVELGVSDEVAAFGVLTPQMLVALGEKGVKTLDDLGDLASDELTEIVGTDNMDEATANDVIMAARAHWFDGGEEQVAAQEAGHD
jgi:transcription termination factor NusA